jgi:methylated-DNA-protein-cysteine methyltransferase-like protein
MTKDNSKSTYAAIYEIVHQIPFGKVATYGQIAELAGLYGKARLVGYALFRVAPDSEIPWHRVINAKGQVSESPLRYGSDYLQRSLLEAEGIVFAAGDRIHLRQYLWAPDFLEAEEAREAGDEE